ncbi:MAG TPA: diguanylate cyclase, partial [Candidatus Omnitrophota bacterium]|nr:diguanylate cyclase [Candidatus Omnitrophota bacterium]
MEKIAKILIVSFDKNLKEVLNFCFDGWGYEVFLEEHLACGIDAIKKIAPDVIVLDVQTAHKSQLELCHLLKDDFTTNFIPIITLINKRHLRQQLLNLRYGVDDYLIKPPDPLDLRVRVEMAMRRTQFSLYASSLTGLPGGRIIEEALKEKIKHKDAPFSFAYVDLDNFKYFNDAYGYLKGDRVIMQAAFMLYTALKRQGNKNDFIGHIGGDDFVFITTPDACARVAQDFIIMFDMITPFHYSPEDRERGFIIARDRSHAVKRIALMSVSVAIVNRDSSSDIENIVQLNEKVVEVKRYLKNIPGSKFMTDRRGPKPGALQEPQVYQKETDAFKIYQPLGQILLEKKILSDE